MQVGNSVIIHKSPIIQQGVKNILLSRNIGISDMMISFPVTGTFSNWKGLLILVDTQYVELINKYSKILIKNGNTIFGIALSGPYNKLISCFDEIIYLDDDIDNIIQKISRYITLVSVKKSNNQLSAREIELLTMVAQGFSNKQIADVLFISIHTVITHRKNITSKLGIKSISGLTLYAALNNLLDSRY
jgi:DNA-binding CsgD family transcriptional regulator